MTDQGKYQHLWMKYQAVIRVLLKKTSTGEQTLKLFKHELENAGGRDKQGYTFCVELINGKFVNRQNSTPIARDLVYILDENKDIKNWLKENSVKFSFDKTFELRLEKIA